VLDLDKKILAIVICVLFFIVILYYGFLSDNTADDQDNGNGNNDVEPEFDVAVLVSADKKVYNSNETVNLTLTVVNRIDISFPYGDYSLGLKYVNKSKYGSISGYSTVDIPWDNINLIEILANETNIYNNSWDITGVAAGDYVILFEIHKDIPTYDHSIEYSAMFEIRIV